MNDELVLLGAGGHAKVVADILDACDRVVLATLEAESENRFNRLLHRAICAIGDNSVRQQVVARVSTRWPDMVWEIALHPAATIADGVKIGSGTVIMPGVILNPGVSVDQHVIVNTGAVIDHDCEIGAFAHIGPGVACAGNVTIGERALVGVGSSIAPGMTIGSGATVGAGSVVVEDIPDGVTAFGSPCRPAST